MGVSLKQTKNKIVQDTALQSAPVEVKELTQELLDSCWSQMLAQIQTTEEKLFSHLSGRDVKLEENSTFVIIVSNSYVEASIKPFIVRILSFLRKKTGHPELNCRIEIVAEERKVVTYFASEKYEAMAARNPDLEHLRILFPDIDL